MDLIAGVIQKIALLTIPILVAVTFHELAHGFVAYRLGDPTAKYAGRLTINPIRHLDPVGTLVFIVTGMIGWAKPVPVNPYNLRDPRRDMVWISLAGPVANLLIAGVSAILFRFLMGMLPIESPVGRSVLIPLILMVRLSVILNIGLAIFNLLPVPPLDGSKVLMGLLPYRQAVAYGKIEPYGFLILLGLIFLGVTDYIVVPLIIVIKNILIGG